GDEGPQLGASRLTLTNAEAAMKVVTGDGEMMLKLKSQEATLDSYMKEVSDAPACDVCGNVTVRSGTCYKCLNCGNSLGCS
ncbi:MAG: hypothetical protein ACK5SZ_00055, partial [bacterium]